MSPRSLKPAYRFAALALTCLVAPLFACSEGTPEALETTSAVGAESAGAAVQILALVEGTTAVDAIAEVAEDDSVAITVTGTDPEGDLLAFAVADGPSNGTVGDFTNISNAADFTTTTADITYTPEPDFHGTDSFTFTVDDGNGGTATGTVTVTVTPVDDAPDAVDDAYELAVDETLTVPTPGVLGNDSHPDGDDFSVSEHTQPGNGTVTVEGDGAFTYVPEGGFTGVDTFEYTVSDGDDNVTATVTLNVGTSNDPPVAVDDAYDAVEDTTLTVTADDGVLANDSDPDAGDTLTATLLEGVDADHGAVTLAEDGSFSYDPAADFHGDTTFTYTVTDALGAEAVGVVTITVAAVNDDPVAGADAATLDENTSVVIQVLLNDYDVDNDLEPGTNVLTIIDIIGDEEPGGEDLSPEEETITITDGGTTITYRHSDPDFFGVDTFQYVISDGLGGEATGTVAVTIYDVNDAPVAGEDWVEINEGLPVEVSVLDNDTDVDHRFDPELEPLFVSAVTDGENGAVTITGGGATVTWTPSDPDWFGVDTFTYTADDGYGGTDTANVIVTVLNVNDPPEAVDDDDRTAKDVTVVIPVLLNDTDPDNDVVLGINTLTVVAVTQPANGTVTITDGGQTVTYAPSPNFAGENTFTYTISDGAGGQDTATVTVRVTTSNEPPTISNMPNQTTLEDTAKQVPFTIHDPDDDPDDLTVTAGSTSQVIVNDAGISVACNAAGACTLTVLPNANASGTVTITVVVTDQLGATASDSFQLTITPVNDAPTFSTTIPSPAVEDVEYVYDANATDVEGNLLTFSIDATTNTCPGATIAPSTGVYRFTAIGPAPPPSCVVGVRVDDNGSPSAFRTQSATVAITAVNDLPTISNITNKATNEDVALAPFGFTIADGDNAPSVLTVVATSSNQALVTDAGFGISCNASGGCMLTITVLPDANGSSLIRVTVSDPGGATGSDTFFLTVNAVADAPVANDVPGLTTDEDVPLQIPLTATDADGQTLTFTTDSVTGGTVSFGTPSRTGNVTSVLATFTPTLNTSGAAGFVYRASDGALSDTGAVEITVAAVDDPPVAAAQSVSTSEDTPLTITLSATDVEGADLTFAIATPPTRGTLGEIDPETRMVVYTPADDDFGTDAFTFVANDGHSDSQPATITITIVAVNDTARATDDAYTTAEDTALTVNAAAGLLANDSDPEGDAFSLISATQPSHGALTANANGSFVYTPDDDHHGADSFTYTLTGGATATVALTITSVEDAPVANDDGATTSEEVAVDVAVLDNDTDGDLAFGDTISIQSVEDPANGAAIIDGEVVRYTPDVDFTGTDVFDYTIVDETGRTATATITVVIDNENDPPTISAISDKTTPEDVATAAIAFTVGDPETSPALLNVTATSSATGVVAASGVALGGSGAARTITLTPVANASGTTTITVTVSDGVLQAVETFTLTVTPVNDAPVATDDSAATDEDVPVTVDVLANDNDVRDGQTLSVVDVGAMVGGTATIEGDDTVTFTPSLDFVGDASFTYTVSDGSGAANDSATATVTITVSPLNDAPVAVDDAYAVDEDTTLTVAAAQGVLANDVDVDDARAELSATILTGPASGALTLDLDGSFTYVPAANTHGDVTFSYTVSDGAATDTGSVTITVRAVDDAAVAADDAYTVDEDGALTVPAPGLLGNDSDLEGDAFSVIGHTAPAHGVVSVGADGGFTYSPGADRDDGATFTYTITGGATATVTFTVTPSNDAPVAHDDAATTDEEEPVTVDVLANDVDVDGDVLAVTAVGNAVGGVAVIDGEGTVTFTPSTDFVGAASFDYTVEDSDGASDTGTAIVTVTDVPDAPVAVADGPYAATEDETLTVDAANGVLANDFDVDPGATLAATLLTGAANGPVTLAGDGSFIYVPDPDFDGDDTFTYTVSDGALTATGTVTIRVSGVNDAPAPADDAIAGVEDQQLVVAAPGVLANDLDVDGDALLVTGHTAPGHGSVTVGDDGGLTYSPAADFAGVDTFEYTVSDDAETATATVTVTITNVNDAPVANDDAFDATEDTTLTVGAGAGVLANDTDPDAGDVLTVTLVGELGAGEGVVTLDADGGFSYDPAADFHGTVSFSYVVTDSGGVTDTATVTIDVGGVNDAPVLGDLGGPHSALEGSPFTLTATATDADDDDLTFSSPHLPAGASLHPTTGALTWTPTWEDAATYQIVVSVTDGVASDSGSFTLVARFVDADLDGLPDAWEPTVDLDPTEPDTDEDGISDGEEVGPDLDAPRNSDDDTMIDALDDDSDDDGVSDAVEAGDDDLATPAVDTDDDGTPDYRSLDSDDDGVADAVDNCRVVENVGQADRDSDDVGDACDDDADGDGLLDADELAIGLLPTTDDSDDDGISDADEVGPDVTAPRNTDSDDDIDALDADSDGDGVSDAIEAGDEDLATPPVDTDDDDTPDYRDLDSDDDGVDDDEDNCRIVQNADQLDANENGVGDACDADADGDGRPNGEDNCPTVANADQADMDEDDVGDVCDGDRDGDSVDNAEDNCPGQPNPGQLDTDDDDLGDACDPDDDGDDVDDGDDNCPLDANSDQEDTDDDGQGDACDPVELCADDVDNDGDGDVDCDDADCGSAQICQEPPGDVVEGGDTGKSSDGCGVAGGGPAWPLALLVLGSLVALVRRRRLV